jgi:hypothetical protein
MFFIFFSVQNPGSFLGDVGHTLNKLSVKNQKAKLFCYRLRKSSFSFYLILNRRNRILSFNKTPGFFLEGIVVMQCWSQGLIQSRLYDMSKKGLLKVFWGPFVFFFV